MTVDQKPLTVIEICAGAGGQALGLEEAGFEHELAVELDENACKTLRHNRPHWKVAEGDVADVKVWNPADYRDDVTLLAGGVPCPPFTIAGKQLGATDERDLFAWAVEQVAVVRPRALLLENVRGLSMPRFAGYRQHVLDRLASFGYIAEWKLLQASDYSVPQLRPRFVLVALKPEDAAYFTWPEPEGDAPKVGETLKTLMGSNGWQHAEAWAKRADKIAPTIVGGSKKHGGADLGPTRAKAAWREMGVDAMGVADAPPEQEKRSDHVPKLTTEMVALLQGWKPDQWHFTGRKTTRYRQIGNAFPPPVAAAVGKAIRRALEHEGEPAERAAIEHDAVYKALRASGDFMTPAQLKRSIGTTVAPPDLERTLSLLSRDFDLEIKSSNGAVAYRLGAFKAFMGQEEHLRHGIFQRGRSQIS